MVIKKNQHEEVIYEPKYFQILQTIHTFQVISKTLYPSLILFLYSFICSVNISDVMVDTMFIIPECHIVRGYETIVLLVLTHLI